MAEPEENLDPVAALRQALEDARVFYEDDTIEPHEILVQTTMDTIYQMDNAAFIRGYQAALNADEESKVLYEKYLREGGKA